MKEKNIAGPLMCWDFFMESHYRRLQAIEGFSRLQAFAAQHDWRLDWDLKKLVMAEERIVLVTDLAQVICFATPNMTMMNGYEVEEVVGQQPKMFQGKDTQPAVRSQIKEAIIRRLPFKGSIVNYRKDGTPYNCLVEEYPVWNRSGTLTNFVAFEKIA